MWLFCAIMAATAIPRLFTALLAVAPAALLAQLSKWPLRTGSGEIRLIDLGGSAPVIGPLIAGFGLGGWEDVNLMTAPSGESLFLTAVDGSDRIEVRRPNGTLIANGAGLLGSTTSQASAIAPRPCHPGQYYLVHHDASAHRHYWSIVDMAANGGQGAVIEKNRPLADGMGEGMAFSRQLANGCRWLFGYKVENGAYRITRARVTPHGITDWAVVATLAPPGITAWWSCLKLSPANDRLALSLPNAFPASAADAVIWNLDLERGELAGPTLLHLSTDAVGAIEFSPAGRYLYFAGNSDLAGMDFGRIDLHTHAVQVIDPAIGWYILAIECAANGRLYVGARNLLSSSLAEVRFPDAPDDIGYTRDAIVLPGFGVIPALPNSIEGEPPGAAPAPQHADFDVLEQPGCQGHLFVPKACAATSYEWDFGDGWTSQAERPVHHYRVGTFSVRLRVTACGQQHSLTKPNLITVTGIQPIASFAHPDSACQHAPVAFTNTSQLATGATWLFGDGATSSALQPTYAFPGHGPRTVTLVARNGCIMDTARSVLQVMPAGLPAFHVTSDPCDERTYFVNTTQGGERFLWEFGDGDTTSTWHDPVHIYRSMGAFEVRLTTDPGALCERAFSQTLLAGYGIIPVAWFIPNAFTPNGDQVNDVLRVTGPEPCQSPVMSVHNQWGQLIWEGDSEQGWDGTVGGMPAPEGVYVYTLRGRRDDLRHGWFVLAR